MQTRGEIENIASSFSAAVIGAVTCVLDIDTIVLLSNRLMVLVCDSELLKSQCNLRLFYFRRYAFGSG